MPAGGLWPTWPEAQHAAAAVAAGRRSQARGIHWSHVAAGCRKPLPLLPVAADHMIYAQGSQPAAANVQHASAGPQAAHCHQAPGLQRQGGGAAAGAPPGCKRAVQLQAGNHHHLLQLAGQRRRAGGGRAGGWGQQRLDHWHHAGRAAAGRGAAAMPVKHGKQVAGLACQWPLQPRRNSAVLRSRRAARSWRWECTRGGVAQLAGRQRRLVRQRWQPSTPTLRRSLTSPRLPACVALQNAVRMGPRRLRRRARAGCGSALSAGSATRPGAAQHAPPDSGDERWVREAAGGRGHLHLVAQRQMPHAQLLAP